MLPLFPLSSSTIELFPTYGGSRLLTVSPKTLALQVSFRLVIFVQVSCLRDFKNLQRLDLGFNNLVSLEVKGCIDSHTWLLNCGLSVQSELRVLSRLLIRI